MDRREAGADLVLIQTFLLYYVNQVILMLTRFFKDNFHNKVKEVCIAGFQCHAIQNRLKPKSKPFDRLSPESWK